MNARPGLIEQLVASVTTFAINMLLMSLAGLIRLLPILLPLVIRLLGIMLILSVRFYHLLLGRLAPPIKRRWGINIMDNLLRVGITILLSLVLGLVSYFVFSIPINGWTIGLAVAHGLYIGLTWDQHLDAGNLTTGVGIPWEN